MSTKLQVLLVDDSAIYRSILTRCLDGMPGLEICGTAKDGLDCLQQVAELRPDLVLLDVEMPNMDGIQALENLKQLHPSTGVIMVSGVDPAVAKRTMRALSTGAFDFVAKPKVGRGEYGPGLLRPALERAIRAYALSIKKHLPGSMGLGVPKGPLPSTQRAAAHSGPTASSHAIGGTAPVPAPAPATSPPSGKRSIPSIAALCIGVSTGGPKTLTDLLPLFTAQIGVPIFVVQHMPEGFTDSLVASFTKICPCPVHEATDGQEVLSGNIYIARGGQHMVVEGSRFNAHLKLTREAPEHHCRPAVDVLFRSLPDVYGPSILTLVLTGMGFDGAKGAAVIRKAGGYCIAQDEASSIVYGMPKAVVDAGEADEILPLSAIGTRVMDLTARKVK